AGTGTREVAKRRVSGCANTLMQSDLGTSCMGHLPRSRDGIGTANVTPFPAVTSDTPARRKCANFGLMQRNAISEEGVFGTLPAPLLSQSSIMASRSLPQNGSPSTNIQGDPKTPRDGILAVPPGHRFDLGVGHSR